MARTATHPTATKARRRALREPQKAEFERGCESTEQIAMRSAQSSLVSCAQGLLLVGPLVTHTVDRLYARRARIRAQARADVRARAASRRLRCVAPDPARVDRATPEQARRGVDSPRVVSCAAAGPRAASSRSRSMPPAASRSLVTDPRAIARPLGTRAFVSRAPSKRSGRIDWPTSRLAG